MNAPTRKGFPELNKSKTILEMFGIAKPWPLCLNILKLEDEMISYKSQTKLK